VMSTAPYAFAKRVFWVVDNGSSHRGQASVDRLQGAWPNLTLVHLPIHASWLNQIEIYFSVIQRKVLNPTTSPIWPRWPIGCSSSSAATNRPQCRSTGASPEPIWTTCFGDSVRNSSPRQHDVHPRTLKKEHMS
jgi:hypothetical protein